MESEEICPIRDDIRKFNRNYLNFSTVHKTTVKYRLGNAFPFWGRISQIANENSMPKIQTKINFYSSWNLPQVVIYIFVIVPKFC